MGKGRAACLFLCLALCLLLPERGRAAEPETETDWMTGQIEGYLEIDKIEAELSELTEDDRFSFGDAIKGLIAGDIPFRPKELLETLSELFFGELVTQKQMALQILLVALASAVFSSFVHVFENNQIADISFYMMYLMLSVLLMSSFSSMEGLVKDTCSALASFMDIFLPSYLITIVLSSGSVTAIGFYEVTLIGIRLLQTVIIKLALPGVNLYLMVLLLNQLSGGDRFSRLAQLLETVIGWGIKSILGAVIGLQAVQCLVSPAVDSLKNSAFHRLASAIPGVGSILGTAAETVAGSAVVIKNAVGVAGILALAAICLTPFLKLAACILLFRLLCAVIDPVCEKRMTEGIESISRGAVLLLRILAASVTVFVVSLAMMTASIHGG